MGIHGYWLVHVKRLRPSETRPDRGWDRNGAKVQGFVEIYCYQMFKAFRRPDNVNDTNPAGELQKNILLQCLFFLNILLCTCQIRAVIKRKEQRGRDGRPPWRSKVYRLLTNAGWASAIHVRVWATPTLRRRENAQGTREEASRSVEIQSRSGAGAQAHQSNTGINTSTALKTRSSRVVAPFCA